jgi:hypothetical protein
VRRIPNTRLRSTTARIHTKSTLKGSLHVAG